MRPNASVRGIDPELFKEVKVDAAKKGITLVVWWETVARQELNLGETKQRAESHKKGTIPEW